MATDTAGVDRALGAIGTTFRLTRLYPPSHPAVQEALRQIGEALPPLAALGTVEWKIGATGLHWQGQHLLPRNTQIAELAGLLYARGVRSLTMNPGMTAEHVLALFQVATGTAPPDAQGLGRITLALGRRCARRERPEHAVPAGRAPAGRGSETRRGGAAHGDDPRRATRRRRTAGGARSPSARAPRRGPRCRSDRGARSPAADGRGPGPARANRHSGTGPLRPWIGRAHGAATG